MSVYKCDHSDVLSCNIDQHLIYSWDVTYFVRVKEVITREKMSLEAFRSVEYGIFVSEISSLVPEIFKFLLKN